MGKIPSPCKDCTWTSGSWEYLFMSHGFFLCLFLFPTSPKHIRTVRSPRFFFAVSFFKIVKHFFFCVDLSVREECDEDPSQSDETEAEMSPPKSPSTPKNVKSKNSGTVRFLSSVSVLGPSVIQFKLFYIWGWFSASCDLLLFPNPPVIKQMSWQRC